MNSHLRNRRIIINKEKEILKAKFAIKHDDASPDYLTIYDATEDNSLPSNFKESKGWGIMSKVKFLPGQYVMYYKGKVTDKIPQNNDYCFRLKTGKKIIFYDASIDDSSFGRLLNDNHCSPNLMVKPVLNEEGDLIPVFFAKTAINPGDPLEYEYQGNPKNYWWRKKKIMRKSSLKLNPKLYSFESPTLTKTSKNMKPGSNQGGGTATLSQRLLRIERYYCQFALRIQRQNMVINRIAEEVRQSNLVTGSLRETLNQIQAKVLCSPSKTEDCLGEKDHVENPETFVSGAESRQESFDINSNNVSCAVKGDSSNTCVPEDNIFREENSQDDESLCLQHSDTEMLDLDMKSDVNDCSIFKTKALKVCINKLSNAELQFQKNMNSLPEVPPTERHPSLPCLSNGMASPSAVRDEEETREASTEGLKRERELRTPKRDAFGFTSYHQGIPMTSDPHFASPSECCGGLECTPVEQPSFARTEDTDHGRDICTTDLISGPSTSTPCCQAIPRPTCKNEPLLLKNTDHTNHINPEKSKPSSSKKKPLRPCFYCDKFRINLSRHLMVKHKNEAEVAALEALPRKEKLMKLKALRNKGIQKENKKRIKVGDPLIFHRNQKDDNVVECTKCFVLVSRKGYSSHKKNCRVQRKGEPSEYFGLLPLLSWSDISQKTVLLFNEEVISPLRNDKLGNFIKGNEQILRLGILNFQRLKESKPTPSLRRQISSYMRNISKIYLHVLEQLKPDGTQITVKEMFQLKYLDHVETAISEICNSQGVKAAMNLLYGYAIRTAANDIKWENNMKGLFRQAKKNDYFISNFKEDWNKNFKKFEIMAKANRGKKLETPQYLPDPQEIETLKNYILLEFKDLLSPSNVWDTMNFTRLRRIVFLRLVIINARKPSEIADIKADQWAKAKRDEYITPPFLENFPKDKIDALQSIKIIVTEEQHTSMLSPVIIPGSCYDALDLLCCPDLRKKGNVLPSNAFLFPSTGTSTNGNTRNDMYVCCEDAGVNRSICSDDARHILGLHFSQLDVLDDVRELVYSHFAAHNAGPYLMDTRQKALGTIEKADDAGESSAEVSQLKPERNSPPEQDTMDQSSLLEADVSGSGSENSACVGRRLTTWTKEDKKHVNLFFKDYLNGNIRNLNGKETLRSFFNVHPNVLAKTCLSPKSKREKVRSLIHNLKKLRKQSLMKSKRFLAE